MLGDTGYRLIVEMELVIDMADEFERLYGINDRADLLIDALMEEPPPFFEQELMCVDGNTAYFIVLPPRRWRETLEMVKKLARV